MSRDYELGFILNPEVSEDAIRTLVGRIEQIVANYGGQIFKINHWGRRRLAYPIDHHRDGYYIFIDMVLTPETVAEIERTLRVTETVFRYMMKRRDPKTVQKEREARAVAAAQAEAASQQSNEETSPASISAEAVDQSEAPAPSVAAETQAEIAPAAAAPDAEETIVLSSTEIESAPSAIEEVASPETVQA